MSPSIAIWTIVRSSLRPQGPTVSNHARLEPSFAVTTSSGLSTDTRAKTDPRSHSRVMIDGPNRAGARSMMRAVGYGDEDFKRPLIGVAHSWIEIMPCNINQRELATWVKEGIREAGGTPVELNTISVSDGIAMGTEGMKASLISREVIADSIELAARGHLFDAIVTISGCDKTIPGCVMAMLRLDIPSLMLYSGSIDPGSFEGRDVTILDVFE